jgi:hypothetical protein
MAGKVHRIPGHYAELFRQARACQGPIPRREDHALSKMQPAEEFSTLAHEIATYVAQEFMWCLLLGAGRDAPFGADKRHITSLVEVVAAKEYRSSLTVRPPTSATWRTDRQSSDTKRHSGQDLNSRIADQPPRTLPH